MDPSLAALSSLDLTERPLWVYQLPSSARREDPGPDEASPLGPQESSGPSGSRQSLALPIRPPSRVADGLACRDGRRLGPGLARARRRGPSALSGVIPDKLRARSLARD